MYGHLSKHRLFSPRGIDIIPRPHSFSRSTIAASRAYPTGCFLQSLAMFSKAVVDNPVPRKPLLSASSRLSSTTSQPSQTAGAKRKFDMSTSSQPALGTLHSSVYFDENDFDDDEDLDLGGSTVASNPAPSVSNAAISNPIIEYPELPSIPKDSTPLPAVHEKVSPREPAPSAPSSASIPWSSSPPSHFVSLQTTQDARKPRPLPWADGDATYNQAIATPPPKAKPSYPWNKTASTIKEEQKEMRKQHKNRTQDKKPRTTQGRAKVPSLFLSEEQKAVLDAVVEKGKSIFFTGSAGTGKSVLMREIITKLRERHRREPDRVAVTASTGLAACNIEGVTLHSFAGIGLGKEDVAELVKKIKRNQKARNRWMRTKILVVDEVSMVDGDLFDKLEAIARKIRNNGRPFGGIQLVVTGDFFQLPPVPDQNKEAKFAFSAATWDTSIQHTILLSHVFRQKDPEFAAMLNDMRLGKLTPPTVQAFKALSRPLDFNDALEATELFPTRREVDDANSARMTRLSGEVMTFPATDSGSIDPKFREKLLANCMAPPVIQLKKGAQVMLIKNMEDTLVNGSLGRVAAFMDEATFEHYSKHEEDFNETSGDLGEGEAADRARKRIKAMGYKEKDGPITTSRKWPLVCFLQPDGTERHLLCQPETWKIELPNGEIQAQRQQVPLILAWALSIHKAQGQTLQRVKVDLGRVFEKGQAYVALSRATSQVGLQVSRFDPKKVMVHPKVTEFYTKLSSISQIDNTRRSESARPLAASNTTNGAGSRDPDDDFEEEAYLEQMYG